MVDPRIYRALLPFVLLAVIIFGFSLENQPAGRHATLPPGQYFTNTYHEMRSLAQTYPDRSPGSADDQRLAAFVAQRLSRVSGFTVSTSLNTVHTAIGTRQIENVTAVRQGLSTGAIVIVSHRDAAGPVATADMSGTAVLLGLANALSGESLNRSVELISTSAQVGMAGATALARQLSSQPIDAVITLGNLAGARVTQPIISAWGSGDTLAPLELRNTVAGFLTSQAGLRPRSAGLGGQFVRLAFPFATTEQAPFNARGIPAVHISLSGDRPTRAQTRLAPASSGRITLIGDAILQSVSALGHGPNLPAPSSYLTLSGKLVPMWAVSLLVLVLILPVAASAVDSLARARRRGHSLLRWVGWVLAGIVPFLVGALVIYLAAYAGVLSARPPGAVGANAVAVTGADIAVIVAVVLAVALSFRFVRPVCLKLVARLADASAMPQTPAADAAATALSLVMCVLSLIVWVVNPFTALLFVPALHLWLWLAQPGLRSRRVAVMLVVVAALLPAVPILVYYLSAYGLTPWGFLWSLVLMVAGGAMPPLVVLYGAATLGCFAGALVIALRSVKAANTVLEAPVTVRGPASYAGPGSLGGTESALRR